MSVTFNWDSYAIAMLALNVALSGTVLGLRLVKWVLPRTPVPMGTPTGTPVNQSAVEFENPTVRDRLSSSQDLNTKSSSSTKSSNSANRSSTKSNKDEIV
ncbi:MAG: hypothetical protein EBU33_10515 [Sphingobacteriia bacterium]|nr:hypothetical protein [Sphingobacteriia bacterium]